MGAEGVAALVQDELSEAKPASRPVELGHEGVVAVREQAGLWRAPRQGCYRFRQPRIYLVRQTDLYYLLSF